MTYTTVDVGLSVVTVSTPPSLAPNAPTGLALTTGAGALSPNPDVSAFQVGWTAATVPTGGTAVTSYRVYRAGVLQPAGAGLTYTATGLTQGTTYLVEVSAVNTFGEGPKASLSVTTATPTGVPPAPSVTLASVTPTTVVLAWAPVSYTPAPTYRVYVAVQPTVPGATGTPVTTAVAGATGVTVSGRTASTAYNFVVTAVNPADISKVSAPSNTVPATTASTGTGTVVAYQADLVVDGFGVNHHANFGGTYGHDQSLAYAYAAADWAGVLGVRHVRDHLPTTGDTHMRDVHLYFLNTWGIKIIGQLGAERTYGTTLGNAQARVGMYLDAVQSFGAAYVACYEAFEGVNEPNNDIASPGVAVAPSVWTSQTVNMQQALYQITKARTGGAAPIASVPIVGPGLARRLTATSEGGTTYPSTYPQVIYDDYGLLRDAGVLAYSDIGNVHCYPSGSNGGKNLTEFLDANRLAFPAPMARWMTEGGYQDALNASSGQPVPDDVQAKYYPIELMESIDRGVQRFYAYELLDDPDQANSGIQFNYGLVETPTLTQGTPGTGGWFAKLQFYALKRFLGLMADPGAAFTPTPLAMTVPDPGAGFAFKKRLHQKRNGKYYLVMWRDVKLYTQVYNPPGVLSGGTYNTVTPVAVTVTLGSAAPVALHKPSTQGQSTVSNPYQTYASTASFTVQMDGEMQVAVIG